MSEERAARFELDDDAPLYVISVAAQLAGLHPQTLREVDRLRRRLGELQREQNSTALVVWRPHRRHA